MIILHKPPSLQPLFHLFFKTIRSLSVLVHSSSWCYHYFQFILVSPYSTYIRFKARQIIGIYPSFFHCFPAHNSIHTTSHQEPSTLRFSLMSSWSHLYNSTHYLLFFCLVSMNIYQLWNSWRKMQLSSSQLIISHLSQSLNYI